MNPVLKALRSMLLNLSHDGPLSNSALNFNLRCYGKDLEPQRQIETTSFC
jgi:hypothetical protein